MSSKSNKQTKQNFYSHILNLNTVGLQISKETLLEAGKSNPIEKMKMSQYINTEADLFWACCGCQRSRLRSGK